MNLSLDDTIATISTPQGRGGIGIVRLSGSDAPAIARSLFRPRHGRPGTAPRTLRYGWVIDPADGEPVDEVLAVYFPAPHTYTRQDMVEFQAHGGPFVLRRILELCLAAGARAAEPGELTLRAFASGRIDLTQAEAVGDIVVAGSEAARRQALGQLDGRLGRQVGGARRRLLRSLATVEAAIDFDEEDAATVDVSGAVRQVAGQLEALLATARAGIVRREGLRVAIVGRPNVGKSSLLNALLRAERAIVTPIAGTTRDTLEESATIDGIAVVFVDTAGLARDSADPVERLGMERAEAALAVADVGLLVLDASEPLTPADAAVARLVARLPAALAVWNKCDLPAAAQPSPLAGRPEVRLSALTGEGLDRLEAELVRVALADGLAATEAVLSSERHRAAVAEAHAACLAALASGLAADMVAADLRRATDALGRLTGEVVDEQLLATIFATFCVGK